MAKLLVPYLFKWQEVEAKSDLERLRLVLDHLADEALMKPWRHVGTGSETITRFVRSGIRSWRGLCISTRVWNRCGGSYYETGNYERGVGLIPTRDRMRCPPPMCTAVF